jgi:hypothetical protein
LSKSIATGWSWLLRIALRSETSGPGELDRAKKVRSSVGRGNTLKLMLLTAARVPKEPTRSFAMSRPVTFLTTMPPELTSLPATVAKVMPMTISRAVP